MHSRSDPGCPLAVSILSFVPSNGAICLLDAIRLHYSCVPVSDPKLERELEGQLAGVPERRQDRRAPGPVEAASRWRASAAGAVSVPPVVTDGREYEADEGA